MSVPPPGGWPPPQQPGQPPSRGQPYGQPFDPSEYNPQQPPPPGWQQGGWAPHSLPPPQKGNSLKWLLIGVAVLLVVAISVGATLLFTRDGNGGGGTTSTSGSPSDVASANDNGPVSIIADEPTCDAYLVIGNGLADVESNGWGAERSNLGESSVWTPDQRAHVQAVASAMRNAADQVVPLAKRTPHRLIRELYEQFAAYGRAYAESISNYTPENNDLASANVNAGSALVGVCNSITYGAASHSVAVKSAASPSAVGTVRDVSMPQPFVSGPNSTCADWIRRQDQLTADTPDWQNIDMSLTASQWTPERRAIEARVRPILVTFADDAERSSRQSGNPILEDFAVASALYLRAYAAVGDDYNGSADGWLSYTGLRLTNLISAACAAANR